MDCRKEESSLTTTTTTTTRNKRTTYTTGTTTTTTKTRHQHHPQNQTVLPSRQLLGDNNSDESAVIADLDDDENDDNDNDEDKEEFSDGVVSSSSSSSSKDIVNTAATSSTHHYPPQHHHRQRPIIAAVALANNYRQNPRRRHHHHRRGGGTATIRRQGRLQGTTTSGAAGHYCCCDPIILFSLSLIFFTFVSLTQILFFPGDNKIMPKEGYLYHGEDGSQPVQDYLVEDVPPVSFQTKNKVIPSKTREEGGKNSGSGSISAISEDVPIPPFLGKQYVARVVEFYAPWCGHCQHFAPRYVELAQLTTHRLSLHSSEEIQLNGSDIIQFHAVSCVKHRQLCKLRGIRGYPTVQAYRAGSDVPIELQKKRLHKSASAWGKAKKEKELLDGDPSVRYIAEELNLDLPPLLPQPDAAAAAAADGRSGDGSDGGGSTTTKGDAVGAAAEASPTAGRQQQQQQSLIPSKRSEIQKARQRSQPLPITPADMTPAKYEQRQTTLYHDAELSFHFALEHGIYMENGPLSSVRREALGTWLDVLHRSLPTDWEVYHLVLDLQNNIPKIYESDVELMRIVKKHKILSGGSGSNNQWSEHCNPHNHPGDGYTCGLWEFFHIVTVGVTERNYIVPQKEDRLSTLYVADALRNYIANFFGCEVCTLHFLDMYDHCLYGRCDALTSDTINSTPDMWRRLSLWLWEAHNAVNVRLMKEVETEDHGRITPFTHEEEQRVRWPSRDLCHLCWNDDGSWSDNTVYMYLKHVYWKGIPGSAEGSSFLSSVMSYSVLKHLRDEVERDVRQQHNHVPGLILLGLIGLIVGPIMWQRRKLAKPGAHKNV